MQTKSFLMCEPRDFNVSYVINPWMEAQVGQVDKTLAHTQWNNLYRIISEKATVHTITEQGGLPDLVFTANAAFLYKNVAYLSHFAFKERQPEAVLYAIALSKLGYQVNEHFLEKNIFFEGAGDALLSVDKKMLFLGYGHRSDKRCFDYLDQVLDQDLDYIAPLELVSPHFYHLDTCFCPLTDGHTLVHLPAFSSVSQDMLQAVLGDKLISVETEDAQVFACNAVEYADKCVVLNEASASLVAMLEERGFGVLQTPLTQYLKSGGAAKCLTLEIGHLNVAHSPENTAAIYSNEVKEVKEEVSK